MSTLVLPPTRMGPLFGARTAEPRIDDSDPCGGELVIDFALCLIAAATVVGLLLLAL